VLVLETADDSQRDVQIRQESRGSICLTDGRLENVASDPATRNYRRPL
jgi:hypothetical protein